MLKKITFSLVLSIVLSTLSYADEWIVRSLANDGAGTLRDQISNAISNPGPDTVIVNVKGQILLNSPILITDNDGLVIIGATAKHTIISPVDGGFSGSELFDINGSGDVAIEAMRFEPSAGTSVRFILIQEYYPGVRIERCLFEGNDIPGYGGAILLLNPAAGAAPQVEITSNSFVNNQAEYGGAVAVNGAGVDFTNNTFYLNRAIQTSTGGFGGAIYIETVATSGVEINHNTFTQNNYGGPGGNGEAIHALSGPVTLRNNAGAGNGWFDQYTGIFYLTSGGNKLLANYGGEPAPWSLPVVTDEMSLLVYPGLRPTIKEDGYGLKYFPIVDGGSTYVEAGTWVSSKQTDCRRAPRIMNYLGDGSILPDAGACEYTEFRVTNDDPSGTNSLEWAINAPKSDPMSYIEFDIPLPMSDIPLTADLIIGERTYVDGFSQHLSSVPGPFSPATPDELTPAIDVPTIDASSIDNALIVGSTASGSIVSGMRLVNAMQNGLNIKSSDTHVFGNSIGFTQTGDVAPNLFAGIRVDESSNLIGGKWHHERNVISGNGGDSGGPNCNIEVPFGADDNAFFGNIIGISGDGKNPLSTADGNDGIRLESNFNQIGENKWGHRNYIGFTSVGINVRDAISNGIFNNFIGVGFDGQDAVPNAFGIQAESGSPGAGADLDIGKFGDQGGNLISANNTAGIRLLDFDGVYIVNNYIGTNSLGTASAGAQPNGILVDGATNNLTIGDVGPPGETVLNIISGNGNGIGMNDVGSGCSIKNNHIGTDYSGMFTVPNDQNGIILAGTANNVTIGNSSIGNLISGNTNSGGDACGIKIVNTSGHGIFNNLIGIQVDNSGTLANNIGIEIDNGTNISVGDASAAYTGNTISGSTAYGVYSHSGGSNHSFFRNMVGTDTTGMNAMSNVLAGIYLDGVNNCAIGGDASNGNVISATTGGGDGHGIWLDGSAFGTSVSGNKIGVTGNGVGALGNNTGILIQGAHQAFIGGDFALNEHNIISGNSGPGIRNESSNFVVIDGNYIGVNTFEAALPNLHGIHNLAQYLTVGGTNGNIISANTTHGVYIEGPDADDNQIYNNMIGTNSAGTADLGNGFNGVLIISGDENDIGSAGKNIIVYNGDDGIALNTNADANVIKNNDIGCNGSALMANGGSGIKLLNGSNDNEIGGVWTSERNNISGNGEHGIHLESSSTGNLIRGNSIGNDGIIGFGNTFSGIYIETDADDNQIGESVSTSLGIFNVISGNGDDGIHIENASGNLVYANTIGLNYLGTTSIPNEVGVYLGSDATANSIGDSGDPSSSNTISGNQLYGIQCLGSGNEIRRNRIGPNFGGTVEIGIQDIGVLFSASSNDNILGGDRSLDFNMISGNENYGVSMVGTGDSVIGNVFGLGTSDIAFTTEQDLAILLGSGANNNVIGNAPKDTYGNVIVNQTVGGIDITYGGNTKIIGNYIGISDGSLPGTIMEFGVKIGDLAAINNEVGVLADNGQNTISNNEVGVFIDGADDQIVVNNLIGTSADGSVAIPNTVGVSIENGASGNRVGGPTGEGNLISGNTEYGILIINPLTSDNDVFGNSIGLSSGGLGMGNTVGVGIGGGASGNHIGDGSSDHANTIADHDTAGVLIDGVGSDENKVFGNVIGDADNPNFFGVVIQNGCQNNSIGGLLAGEGNVISGNDSTGVAIFSSDLNYVDQNIIGLATTGDGAVPNTLGVHIWNSNGNAIGQAAAASNNTITGNTYGGILIESSNDNSVQNNVIGLDPSGTASVTGGFSSEFGIAIIGTSFNNQIGGSETNQHNTISNNGNHGILINNSFENQIIGNNIGLSKDFSTAFPNEIEGIRIENNAASNIIGVAGGTNPQNIISGHSVNLKIVDSDSTTVTNNFIGTDQTGNAILAGTESQSVGVLVEQGSANTELDQNIICGHETGWGVQIADAGSNYTLLKNNHVGIGLNGTGALPNRFGIVVRDGALGSKIGVNGEGNVISGNDSVAVLVEGLGTDSTYILANYIGTNADGTGSHNATFGIGVYDQPSYTFIGGETSGDGNYIVGTDSVAVYLLENSQYSYVSGNFIGQNPAGGDVSTGELGIMIRNSDLNWIGGLSASWGNQIGNCNTGIGIKSGSQTNAIMGNEIYNIANQAIDIDDDDAALAIDGATNPSGNNIELDQPQIDLVFPCDQTGATNLTLITTLPPLTSGDQYRLEFFVNDTESGDAESYLETHTVFYNPATIPDTTFISGLPSDLIDKEITITATESFSGGSYGNTTELSAGMRVQGPPEIDIQTTDVSCDGNTDGTIAVNVPGYDFLSELNTEGQIEVSEDTIYLVPIGNHEVKIDFSNGCSYSIPVQVDTADMSGLMATDDIEVCQGSAVQLDAFGGDSYLWDDDPEISELDIPNPEATPGSEKYFYVTITHENGCEVRDSVYVSFIDISLCDLQIYNVITPNGDGDNDSFHIEGIEGYDLVTVYIYNRWGDLIRKIEDYDNYTNAWDGTKRNGSAAQTGTYYYVVDVGDSPQSQSGYIQVLR